MNTPDRSHILTEQRLPDSMNLDTMEIADAVALMNRQDRLAVDAVATQRDSIARAVERVVKAFKSGGRLIYVGAGTSGRLGVLDASECPPTFRTDPQMVQGILAGGPEAMFKAREGAEDRPEGGSAAMDDAKIGPADVVLGIAAGGTTPFVQGALSRARQLGAGTIFLTCAQPFANETPVDISIRPLTGAEILTGSTRLKAATATKLILNTISTLAMVRLGKVYENLMVDLKATNDKLRDRAGRIVATICGISRPDALELLQRADGQVKAAIVMHHRKVDFPSALQILDQHDGHLRSALNDTF
ncbi:MAG: N-acetylmuramic acid 6-phosphate etherase [Phycisphaerales bacterium]|jgi:N-acetylmuramic acid 6-phosphate etherase|nr:N-acetylmuramic acid 6-phosphate etherase [Phycisphaerales bacterium]